MNIGTISWDSETDEAIKELQKLTNKSEGEVFSSALSLYYEIITRKLIIYDKDGNEINLIEKGE